jgi:hypothetical protein
VVDAPKTKTKGDWISWKNRPYDSSRSNEANRRAELWQAFCDFVRSHRGWIVSPPGSRVAVLETERGSALPSKLVDLGYQVTELANGERVIGGGPSLAEEVLMRQGYQINARGPTMPVDRYEVTLPWAGPPPQRPV